MAHYFNELTPEERNELLHSTTVKVIINFLSARYSPNKKTSLLMLENLLQSILLLNQTTS